MAFSSFFGSNPVLLRELRAGLRNARAFALLAIYVAILGAIVIVKFPADEKIDILSNGGVKGLDLFWILVWGQVLLILALLPALSTGALAQERERQTLEPLMLTPLSPLQIVWGKAGGVLSIVGLLLLASLPLTSLCFLLGGLSPGMLIAAYAGIFGLAVFTTGFGLYCAARWHSATKALMACYAFLPVALIVVALFSFLGSLFSGLCLMAMLFYGLAQKLKKGEGSSFAQKVGPFYGRLIYVLVPVLIVGLLLTMYFDKEVGLVIVGVGFVFSYFVMAAQWGLLQTARELMLRNDPEAPMRQKIADFKADWKSAVAPPPVSTAYVPTPQTQSEWAAVTMHREAPAPPPSNVKRKPSDSDTYGKAPFLSDKLNPIYARELRAGLLGKFEYLFRFSYILTIVTELGLFAFLLYSLYDPAYMMMRYDDLFIYWGRCHLVLLLIFGAWFGARAIAPEREGQTLPQLFTIPLPSIQIIGGKLAAVLTFTLYVLVLAIPLAILLPLAGLTTWTMTLRFLLVELVMGALSASWGVYCSFHATSVRGAMAWALGGVSVLMVAPALVMPLHDVLDLLGLKTSSSTADIIGSAFPMTLLFAPVTGPGNFLIAYYRVPIFFNSDFQWLALAAYAVLAFGFMAKAARDFQRTAREI